MAILDRTEALAAQGKTPLFFAKDTSLLGVIAVADTPKPTSRDAVAAFKSLGIDVIMLTGDNYRTAEAIGQQLGVTEVMAEVLPQDKERKIASLQQEGKKVAMVASRDVSLAKNRGVFPCAARASVRSSQSMRSMPASSIMARLPARQVCHQYRGPG